MLAADLNEQRGDEVVREIDADARFARVDVSDADSCKRMASAALEAWGRIDVLVNNAAIFSTIEMKPFWELSEREWDSLKAVNLKGVWLASRAVAGTMREARSGSIINISSGAIYLARPNYAHYLSAKTGIIGLTRGMARELGAYGVRVNASDHAGGGVHRGAARDGERRAAQGDAGRDSARTRGRSRRSDRHGRVPRLRRQPLHHRPDDQRRRGPDLPLRRGALKWSRSIIRARSTARIARR
jgi:NAD(P)-dependent dehydrogenase (short-subunit alcohol dehydrogenase family)